MIRSKPIRSTALAGSLGILLSGAAIAEYRVAIALDEALTKPLHLGKRYVATDEFQAARQQGKNLKLEASAGTPDAQWTAEDKSLVSVSPTNGEEVTLTLKKCDIETKVYVSSSKGSRTLSISTYCDDDTIRGVITQ